MLDSSSSAAVQHKGPASPAPLSLQALSPVAPAASPHTAAVSEPRPWWGTEAGVGAAAGGKGQEVIGLLLGEL